jgi:2',3'-cyclic-nucleotide 2'-phosphodiesterase (5'-nucleotidase family)
MTLPFRLLVVAVVSACAAASCWTPERRAADRASTVTISIVGTNDLHGTILPANGRGGLALLDGFIRNLRAQRAADGGGVLLLDAGDLFQGSLESNLTEGAVIVSAYNAMGYAASAIGNHEFDFGPAGAADTPDADDDPQGALKARVAEARFPFLAANILDDSTNRPVQWPNVRPSTIVHVANFRVGIVGLTTAEAFRRTMAANTRGLTIAPLAPTLTAEAARLRQSGATIVVATAHAGGTCHTFGTPVDLSSCVEDEEIFRVARQLPSGLVDAIVAGHRHAGIAHEVAGIPIINSYWRGRAFGRIDLVVDRASGRVQHHRIFPPREVCAREDPESGQCVDPFFGTGRPAQYEGRPAVASDEIAAVVAPAVARVRTIKERPLNAELETAFPLLSGDESPLGNLVADWMRTVVPSADAAIMNHDALRAALPAGRLIYGHLYELLPFNSREVLVALNGGQLRRVIEHTLRQSDDLLLVSGVRATATCERQRLHIALRRDSGAAVQDNETLIVVTNDFLASGGDDVFTPIFPLRVVRRDGPLIREHIAAWLTGTARRWRAVDLTAKTRRIGYPGTRPVTCETA